MGATWYHGNGTADMAHDEHVESYELLLERCDFYQEGADRAAGDNIIFIDKEFHSHSYESWILDLYNFLMIAF